MKLDSIGFCGADGLLEKTFIKKIFKVGDVKKL
jgi:hypothetical protein